MSRREEFINKLKNLSKEEMLERYVALLNSERLTDNVADLETKLAEKEKEIESLKQGIKDTVHIYSDEFVEKDKELKELRYKVSNADQEKISFAVEQLEKVKEHISSGLAFDIDVQMWFEGYIDNQIEELKRETK